MKAPPLKCQGTCAAVVRTLREITTELLAAATAPTLSHSPATPGVAPVGNN